MPEDVKDEIGQSLQVAEWGGTPDNAKPLRGARFRGVWEIVANFNTDTYRGVYTVRFAERVYVLHCFVNYPRPQGAGLVSKPKPNTIGQLTMPRPK